MEKAASRLRIGMMFGVMAMGVVGSIIAVILGKRDRAAHVGTLRQKNKERHARAAERAEKEQTSK